MVRIITQIATTFLILSIIHIITLFARSQVRFFVIGWILILLGNQQSSFLPQWKLERMQCWSDTTICSPLTCNITRPNRNTQLMYTSCNLSAPLDAIRIHVQLFRRYQVYQPFMVNIEFDACALFSDYSLFSMLFLPHFAKYSNLNHSCPYNGFLHVDAFQLDMAVMNSFQLLQGQYYLGLNFYAKNNESIYFSRTYFTISPKYVKSKNNWDNWEKY